MRIVNIVSLWLLRQKIRLASRIKAFNADIIRENSYFLLLFESGKIIATGFTTLRELNKFVNTRFPNAKFIRIINITALEYIRSKINLKGLSYEPEIFHAYLWRKGKVTIVYYTSGKLIVTGGKIKSSVKHTMNLNSEQV